MYITWGATFLVRRKRPSHDSCVKCIILLFVPVSIKTLVVLRRLQLTMSSCFLNNSLIPGENNRLFQHAACLCLLEYPPTQPHPAIATRRAYVTFPHHATQTKETHTLHDYTHTSLNHFIRPRGGFFLSITRVSPMLETPSSYRDAAKVE